MTRIGAIWGLVVLLGISTAAQTLRFEIASVRPTKEKGREGMSPSSFTTTRTVQSLIGLAYQVGIAQILGGEAWTRQDLFEVRATLPEPSRDASLGAMERLHQVSEMMRHLLQERFALRSRVEERSVATTLLRIKDPKRVAAPGRLAAAPDCVQRGEAMRARLELDAKGGAMPLIAPGGLIQTPCGIQTRVTGESFSLVSKGTTVAELAMHLSRLVGQEVEDGTGLSGYFGLDLEMSADQDPLLKRSAAEPGLGRSLATALGEDLNLSLVAGRSSRRVIVIESVQRPTEN